MFLAGGLAVAYVQLWRPSSWVAYCAAHLLAGGVLLAFFTASSVPPRAWIGMAYYGGFGLTIALYPWLETRLCHVDPTSLGVRMAFALVMAAILPLILAATLVTELLLRGVEAVSDAGVQVARDISFATILVFGGITVVIGIYVARRLAAPLEMLTRMADRIAAGDAAEPVPGGGAAEIERLAESLREMRDRLSDRTAERERLLERIRTANERLIISSIEQQSRAAELEATIDSMVDGVIIYGPDGELTRFNRPAEAMLGYTKGESQTKEPLGERTAAFRVETPEGKPFSLQDTLACRALQGETVAGITMVLYTPDGRILWVSASVAPIRTPDGELRGAVAILSDITQLHELEEEREDLLRTVSHDLRSPLTAIKGQAQLMLRQLEQTGQHSRLKRSAQALVTTADRMNSMIQDLVDMTRLEGGQLQMKREPLDLESFWLELRQRLGAVLAVDRVRIEMPQGLPRVSADPDRLERIFTNLLSNALKYSPSDTEVLVTAEGQDGMVEVSVTDRGVGMTDEDVRHLFQRYYRARDTRKIGGGGVGAVHHQDAGRGSRGAHLGGERARQGEQVQLYPACGPGCWALTSLFRSRAGRRG